MKGLSLFCLATSFQNKRAVFDARTASSVQAPVRDAGNNEDAIFNAWCSDVGIECPGAEVRTTKQSVAGRGVFATKDLEEGDVAISVPLYAALTQENAARYFPKLAEELKSRRGERRGRLKRVWDRVRRRPAREERTAEDCWQAELAAYALKASREGHPWSTWISQWGRDDPWQRLVDESAWRDDDGAIEAAVSELKKMAPAIPDYKLGAAVGIRLDQLNGYSNRYGDGDDDDDSEPLASESVYGVLLSRAIGLSDAQTAVLPMHDMINHSPNPNLGFAFSAEDESFKMIAMEDIPRDEELFLQYFDVNDEEGRWDEDKAAWLLVTWGIPSSPPMEEDTVTPSRVAEEAGWI